MGDETSSGGQSGRPRLSDLRAIASFNLRRHLRGYPTPEAPHLDPGGLELFTRSLAGVRVYLEYGSGGSTVAAARVVRHVMSVDNDAVFLRAVARGTRGAPATCHFLPVNTGVIREWGYPAFPRATARRRRRWRRYVEEPWRRLRALGLVPDLCVVDGRFRVACALHALLESSNPSLTLLLDDYEGREHYREVERHAEVVERGGRMVSLRRRPDLDEAACREALERHLLDYR